VVFVSNFHRRGHGSLYCNDNEGFLWCETSGEDLGIGFDNHVYAEKIEIGYDENGKNERYELMPKAEFVLSAKQRHVLMKGEWAETGIDIYNGIYISMRGPILRGGSRE
jgi:hypothetical protein